MRTVEGRTDRVVIVGAGLSGLSAVLYLAGRDLLYVLAPAPNTLGQTGPFRPSNTVRGVDNVVLAGSSTVPGVGVPTAILSGRLAADRITGVSTRQPDREVYQR